MSRHPTGAATLHDTQMLPDTQVMPAPTSAGRHREPAAEQGWLRQWRVSLIGGAVIVATVLAVSVAVLAAPDDPPAGPTIETATDSAQPSAAATPEPTTPQTPAAPSAGPTRAVSVAPMDRLAAFAIAVQQQVNAGNLDADAGRDLLQAVNEIARRLNRGHNAKAAQGLTRLDNRLAELRREGALSRAGFAALDTLGPIISSLRERG